MFAKVNGKDVLWGIYTLRLNNSGNFFSLVKQQRKSFSERKGGMSFNVISEK